MENARMEYLTEIEEHGAENGWVQLLSQQEKDYFAYLRGVFRRYNIVPSRATKLEYNFVLQVAESEFFLQKANA